MESPCRRSLAAGLVLALAGAAGGLQAPAPKPVAVAGSPAPAAAGSLGEIRFPTSGAAAAQPDFERGVLLLHSFEYDDAAAAFREAERRDPGFAMAYWGEAMTYNHPLWHQQDRAAAQAALARLAPTPEARRAKAPSAREQAWLAAVETLYGEGDKASRDRRYAAAMERLSEGDRDDLEAASFYALALLGSCEAGREIPVYMQAAAVAEGVFARNPRHPGAVHYLIHSYDDPAHAPLGLPAARVYARIAPAAAHALHMPSHIFLALGMWDDVAASNEASWAASEERRRRLSLPLEERGYHALSWLAYAYLQQGRLRDARRLLAEMAADAAASAATGSPRTREHLALMQAGYRIESRDWRADLGALPGLDGIDGGIAAAARFAHGLAALRSGDPAAARRDLAALDAINAIDEQPRAAVGAPAAGQASPGPAPAHGGAHGGHGNGAGHGPGAGYGAAAGGGASSAQRSGAILRAELAAVMLLGPGNRPAAAGDAARRAVAALERAAADEDATSYEFGPPVVVKPAHELAGELLLDLGQPAAARRHFEQALARAPRRSLSLLGLARAAARAGDAAAAAAAYADLAASWRRADADLPELAEVTAGAKRSAAAVAPATTPHAAFVPPPAEALLAGEIDQARLQRLVRELVQLGPRMGGTPSGDRAAAAIAADFAAAGLAPQTIVDPPRPAHWEDAWSVELVPGGPLASAWPYGFSPSVGPVAAPLVVVRDPAELKAAPPAGWRGKIVYVPGDVLGAYRHLAAGADRPLAILTSAPNDGRRYLDAAFLAALPAMPAGGGRPLPVFAVSYQDGRRLAAAAAAPSTTVRVMLRSTVRDGSPRTVLADLAGRAGQEKDRYYLICAHGDSDSGGPGADDNGSGEAVVLELARVLAGLVRTGRLPAPRVALRFVVWGSEYASSGAYAAREGDRLRRCLGVINLDEVGTGAERDAVYFESNEVPWNRELLRAFDRVGADYAGRPGFWPEYTTNPSQGGTDSYAFLPRRYKGELASDLEIPATTVYTAAWDQPGHLRQTPGWESPATPDPVHLTIDYSRYYHSSGDTPGNTTDRKPEAMVRAARAIGIALLRLAFQAPR